MASLCGGNFQSDAIPHILIAVFSTGRHSFDCSSVLFHASSVLTSLLVTCELLDLSFQLGSHAYPTVFFGRPR